MAAKLASSVLGSGAPSGMRQKSCWRTSLPAPSNSSSRPGQSRSTPLTAAPGPITKPFHTLLATACGSRRGASSSPEANQSAKLRGEDQRPARIRIRRPRQVERLDSQGIPGQQEPALFGVPAREGEHAAKPAYRARPVQAEGAEHDGRVARGSEFLPLGLQAPPELPKIIDLAVEDNHVPGHRVHHGLGAGGREIEDREPAVGEKCAPTAGVRSGGPYPTGVRGRGGPSRRSSAPARRGLGCPVAQRSQQCRTLTRSPKKHIITIA